MPGMDGRGPLGTGPLGRGLGPCQGGAGQGRGQGRGAGQGRGPGRGFGGNVDFGDWPGRGRNRAGINYAGPATTGPEVARLAGEVELMEKRLAEMKRQLDRQTAKPDAQE